MSRSKGERTGKEWDGLRSGRVGGGRGVRSRGGGGEMGWLEECEGWRRKRIRRGVAGSRGGGGVLLSFLSEKNIFLSIFSYPFSILKTSIWFPLNRLVSRVVKPHPFRHS